MTSTLGQTALDMALGASTEEMVWTQSEDDLLLDGILIRPVGAARSVVVIHFHGFTGRFSHPFHVGLGRALASRGYASLSGNSRSAGVGDWIRRGPLDKVGPGAPLMIGAAWERFGESVYDVGAWVAFAAGLGLDRVALLGHSRGARKVAYYQGTRQDPRVAALILASAGSVAPVARDPEQLSLAERLVAAGRGLELLPWRPGPDGQPEEPPVSAQTYLANAPLEYDPYGADNPDPAIRRVRCPVLSLRGSLEGSATERFARMRRAAGPDVRVDTDVVEGADHVYAGRVGELATAIAGWLDAAV